jgi:NADH-quinone oxidoreductase subunit K
VIVPFGHVLALAAVLFTLGAACACTRRNLILVVIGVEIMLNAAGLAFVGGSLRWQELQGQAFVVFLLAIAAAEVAVGLALIVHCQRRTGSLDPDHYDRLRG